MGFSAQLGLVSVILVTPLRSLSMEYCLLTPAPPLLLTRVDGILCDLMWLGPKRGHLTDWTTQLWVKTTGILTDLQSSPWLEGPIARPTGIGTHFFDDFAAERGLSVQSGTGLIKNLAELSGPGFKVGEISAPVRHFYENTT